MQDNVHQLNQKVTVNLDELERGEVFEKFSFVLGGQRVEMLDPAEIDFKDLMTIEHPANFLDHVTDLVEVPCGDSLFDELELCDQVFDVCEHVYLV